jgi:hypothetical protein
MPNAAVNPRRQLPCVDTAVVPRVDPGERAWLSTFRCGVARCAPAEAGRVHRLHRGEGPKRYGRALAHRAYHWSASVAIGPSSAVRRSRRGCWRWR